MFIILATTTSRGILILAISIVSCAILNSTLFTFIAFPTLVSFSLSHFILNLNLIRYLIPYCVDAVTVAKSLEDAITTNHYEIEIVLNFETLNIWIAHYYVWIATIARAFGFDITKCLGDRESSREDPQWSLYIKILLAWVCCCFCKCLGSIYLTTSGLNSNLLEFIIWFVISSQHTNLSTCIY